MQAHVVNLISKLSDHGKQEPVYKKKLLFLPPPSPQLSIYYIAAM